MRHVDPTTLTLWREHVLNVHALFELTGIPTLYRWGRAIWERRPIHEVEREYFERIYRQLQQLGAAPARLEVQPQLRGVVPADHIAEGRRAPPVQAPQILAPDVPQDVRERLRAVGVPTSPEDVAGQVAGRSLVLAAAVLPPGLAGMTKEAAKQLAKTAAAGFGVGGTAAAGTRVAQGFPEEAPRAFLEVGLASTVVGDIASALRALATGASVPQLRAAAQQVLRRRQEGRGLAWRDPEGEAFLREIEEALLALKRGDTSKYDALLKKFEEWQKKVEEFNKLYELKRRGELPPDRERDYTRLLGEVSQIRDRYDLLKQYIETAREMGLETRGRHLEFQLRTLEDLARATQEAPPGPPPKDVMQWLQRVDLDFLQRLVRDQGLLGRYARRFGVDEQMFAERAALVLRERQWERLANLSSDELKKILMDESTLRRYADELGVDAGKLRVRVEELLQRRMGVRPAPEPQPAPERPPIERMQPKRDLRPPETEGAVVTREGQVLIVMPKEGVVVARLEELPNAQTRLRALLMRRLQGDDAAHGVTKERGVVKDVETVRASDEPKMRVRDEQTADARVKDEQAPRAEGGQAVRVADEQVRVADVADRVVLDRETLRSIVPALPAYVFSMPAPTVLAMISRAVGAPLVLAPGLPKPLPREPFGRWLDRVFAGTGFSWRAVAAQRETFVFA
jgi:predicted nuclease with TOPRIM domain